MKRRRKNPKIARLCHLPLSIQLVCIAWRRPTAVFLVRQIDIERQQRWAGAGCVLHPLPGYVHTTTMRLQMRKRCLRWGEMVSKWKKKIDKTKKRVRSARLARSLFLQWENKNNRQVENRYLSPPLNANSTQLLLALCRGAETVARQETSISCLTNTHTHTDFVWLGCQSDG